MERWEDRSKEYIHNFIGLFEKSGVLNLLNRTRSPAMLPNHHTEQSDTEDDDITILKTNPNKKKSKQYYYTNN
jgi:hypothetical protein